MTRNELEQYISETYNTDPDYPWEDSPGGTSPRDTSPNAAVFRHANNRKWFALVMRIPRGRLGLDGAGDVDIVNLKCGPIMTGSMLGEAGFFRAYHMNKAHWISAALDGSADDERIKLLLDISFEATAAKVKGRHTKDEGGM